MKRKPSELIVPVVALVCVLLLAACNSGNPTLRYITISPATSTISAGTTQQYTATGYYSNGAITPGISVTWSSTSPSVATIDPVAGVATAVAPGTSTINANALGISATSASLSVNALTALSISPLNQTIASGGTEQFDAMGTFKNANGTTSTTDVTSQVTWASSNTSVITIDSTGLATSVASGTSQISAALDGLTASTNLTAGAATPVSLSITPGTPNIAVGNAMVLTVTENWSDGSTGHTPTAAVTWSSDTIADANVAPISANTASVAGFAAGTAHITASESSSITGTVPVTVVVGQAHYAYVSNNGSNTIQWYSVSTSTSPYLTSGGTLAQSNSIGATQTVIHPSGQYLYYTDNKSNIWVTTINSSTGALTATSFPSQVAGSGNTNFTVIDPYGRFLYVSDDAGNTIYGFQINQTDGSLALISGLPLNTNLDSPECLVIDHTGSYLYATNPSNNTISAYMIDQTNGALTPLSTPSFPSGTGTGPLLGALDPSGTHLYVANASSNSIAGFSIGTGGVLTSLGTDTAVSGAIAIENLVVDPTGTRIYVLDSGSATGEVFGFIINSGGVIGAAISGTPIATGTTPLGAIVIDPTDAILAVDSNGSNNISLYTIGSGGALTAATPPSVSTGTAPLYVTFYNAP
jgi:6-phosphogluconolactonase (cycloisomerase 2 family)